MNGMKTICKKIGKSLKIAPFSAVLTVFCACNPTASERFAQQTEYTAATQTTSTLTAYGASRIDALSDRFRCPSVSGIASSNNVTVFSARANASMPYFALESAFGIRSDASGGFAVSLSEFPAGLLDIYERCNSTPTERFVTSCPDSYEIVDECSSGDFNSAQECIKRYEGTHKLVISAEVSDDETCFTEEADRSPYSETAPAIAQACDAFSPIALHAAYRGESPVDLCCAKELAATLDFCIRPCGCRKLIAKIVPKEDAIEQNKINQKLRIAVFSNVSGHKDSFEKLIKSIQDTGVDVIVSLGNLTSDGSQSAYSSFFDAINDAFVLRDGQETGSDRCKADDSGSICCQSASDRAISAVCNAVMTKTPFIAGLGSDEVRDDVSGYNGLFGVSNTATAMGKVQIIVLDSADASLSSPTKAWLSDVLALPDAVACSIPPRDGAADWPTLAACRDMLSATLSAGEKVTCRECIGEEAYCIVPDNAASDPSLGPENCVCVPISSKICRSNMTCKMDEAGDGVCSCTRDEDCGIAGTCVSGACAPPLRLVMMHVPPFDQYGTRNNAFTSKSEAVALMSLFARSGVAAVFSGKSADYGAFSMADIPIYITGGGGASMASFSKYGHHWLLVEIDNAYRMPSKDDISVSAIEF